MISGPSGRRTAHYLAFVSDRAQCPSWIPGEPGTCDGTDTPAPDGGSVYVLELATDRCSRFPTSG